MVKKICAIVLAGLLPFTAATSVISAELSIDEWPVPWSNTRPRDPFVDSNGLVWFVGQRGHYVAALDPTDGRFEQLELDPGTGPHNLIVGSDDTIWYAGNLASHIGRLDAASGAINKIMMPDPDARDPHTLVFDAGGNIWFTVQGGNMVGHLDVTTEQIDLIRVPRNHARPYGIVLDAEGTVWVCNFGTNQLLRIEPNTRALTEIDLPRHDARPRRLAATSNGDIWYVDYAGGMLGRYQPDTGEFDEWATPGGPASRPYGMAVDAWDRLWFVEGGVNPNQFVGFDPASEAFFARAAIPSGGGTVRHMIYDAPRNVVWFGTDANTIGRANLPTADSSTTPIAPSSLQLN